ncbi:MAG TPA: sulfatase [Gemmatimonadaceae bacterium]|nr:sulfatase [Gemmatimonadaceae bacterium]
MSEAVVDGGDAVEPNAKTASAPHSLASDPPWKRGGDFVVLGVLFGVVTGLAEFALRWFIAFVLHQPSHHDFGVDLLWMLPAANLLLLGGVGAFFGVASTRWRGDWLGRAALAAFTAAAVLAMLFHFRMLHEVVSAVLSAGIGVRFADVIGGRRDRIGHVARRLTWPAVGAVGLIAFSMFVTRALMERRALSKLGPAPANAANVLIVVLDAVRAPSLSVYGYGRRTSPELERFAAHSVKFERAIVTAPWSLPSHASMFTGRYAHELSADWDVPLDATYPTLAEVLRNRGYATAGFVANNFYGKPEFGLSRGFLHYESRKFGFAAIIATSKLGDALVRAINRLTTSYHRPGRMAAPEVNRRLLDWVPSRGSRPFFVFVNYFDVHTPYVAPPPHNRLFSGTEPPTREMREGHRKTSAELEGLRDAYDQSISYVDSQLGILLKGLETRGALANTLVIVTSDHGEEFGEHGWAGHGNGLYLPGLHVPLLIAFPGRIPGGTVIGDPVTLRDLPATVLDLLAPGRQGGLPGNSLASRWRSTESVPGIPVSPVLTGVTGPENAPSWYAVAKGDMKSIIVGKNHYIRNGDGREELFDIVADPWETRDLARAKNGNAELAIARHALDSAIRTGRRVIADDRVPHP